MLLDITISEQRWTFYRNRVGAALDIYKQFESFVCEYPVDDIYCYDRSLFGNYLCTFDEKRIFIKFSLFCFLQLADAIVLIVFLNPDLYRILYLPQLNLTSLNLLEHVLIHFMVITRKVMAAL